MARSYRFFPRTPEPFDDSPGDSGLQKNESALVGSLDKVHLKIRSLEKQLQNFPMPTLEVSDDTPSISYSFLDFQSHQTQSERREKEEREIDKFACLFMLKTTFNPIKVGIDLDLHKIIGAREKINNKTDSVKLKLIELYEYPGFNPEDLTPLPHQGPSHILEIVAKASMDLDKKPMYRPQFSRLFFLDMSKALLQDFFWYLYLQHFHPNFSAQRGHFNRAAHNYVKLLFFAKDQRYKDTFFRDYPGLMSQAVYAAYCHCFPDSYRLYDEDFKNELVYLVYGWMAGLKPSPRCWLEWRMHDLEPPNIQKRQEAMEKSVKKINMTFNFDYLDSLVVSPQAQRTRSTVDRRRSKKSQVKAPCLLKPTTNYTDGPKRKTSSLAPQRKISKKVSIVTRTQKPSTVSASEVPERKVSSLVPEAPSIPEIPERKISQKGRSGRFSRTDYLLSVPDGRRKMTSTRSSSPISGSSESSVKTSVLEPSVLYKNDLGVVVASGADTETSGHGKDYVKKPFKANQNENVRVAKTIELTTSITSQHSSNCSSNISVASGGLTPGSMPTTENGSSQVKKLPAVLEKGRNGVGKAMPARQAKQSQGYRMKSHPANTGPDFSRAAFNVHGHSPLVAHYLKMRDVTADLNTVVRIEHAQIDKLPPLNAPTYQDAIKQSCKKVKTIERLWQELTAKNQKESLAMVTEQTALLRAHRKKQVALLANQSEVKRFSELLAKGMDKDAMEMTINKVTKVAAPEAPADLLAQSDLREKR